MFTLAIPPEIQEQVFLWQKMGLDVGQRKSGDNGNKWQQTMGIVAENTMRHYMGFVIPTPKIKQQKPPAIVCDIRNFLGYWNIDIKCMSLNINDSKALLNPSHNVYAWQTKDDSRYISNCYIFCARPFHYVGRRRDYHNELMVYGWCTKFKFKEKSVFYKKDTPRPQWGKDFRSYSDMFEISNSELHQLSSIDDLKQQLKEKKPKPEVYIPVDRSKCSTDRRPFDQLREMGII